MKFKIEFAALGWKWGAINIPGRDEEEIGIRLLDEARAALPNENITRVSIATKVEQYTAILTEEEARQTYGNLFQEQSKITVHVDNGALNKYVSETWEPDYDTPDGSVCAYLYRSLNGEKLLDEWRNAGCPIEWDNSRCTDRQSAWDAVCEAFPIEEVAAEGM